MADATAQHSAPRPPTVADIMHPPVRTVVQNDYVAAAAYLMKRADATALIVTQAQTGRPIGLITHAGGSPAGAGGVPGLFVPVRGGNGGLGGGGGGPAGLCVADEGCGGGEAIHQCGD